MNAPRDLARWEWVTSAGAAGGELRLEADHAFRTGKPAASPQDKTTVAAREIIDAEAQERAERTAALKAARLARDAAEAKKKKRAEKAA
ncbi:hypothetical protein [Pseudooceanicola sp. LIPI14-2-Ac024]|uniref:hypothetical protein n=1 Tax=Pseudooceanicola sp. LIPI14-2-Ac024 TaxID=3344875 RepID=UPI0035D0E789